MRRAAKVDATQRDIVWALRDAGAWVLSLAAVGQGVPDLLVCFRGVLRLLECKTGRAKLTADQVDWHRDAAAYRVPVAIVRTPEDALTAIGALRASTQAAEAFPQPTDPANSGGVTNEGVTG